MYKLTLERREEGCDNRVIKSVMITNEQAEDVDLFRLFLEHTKEEVDLNFDSLKN